MDRQGFENVWDALEDTPSEAARRLGVTQPRLNNLLRGRIRNFSLDALINLAGAAGLTVRLEIADAA
jgi:predicted XRE-type DNA-binding protein